MKTTLNSSTFLARFFADVAELWVVNSKAKILSTNWPQDFAVTGLNRLGIDYEAVSQLYDIHAVIGSRPEYDLFVSYVRKRDGRFGLNSYLIFATMELPQ